MRLDPPKKKPFWAAVVLTAISLVMYALHVSFFNNVPYLGGFGYLILFVAVVLLWLRLRLPFLKPDEGVEPRQLDSPKKAIIWSAGIIAAVSFLIRIVHVFTAISYTGVVSYMLLLVSVGLLFLCLTVM